MIARIKKDSVFTDYIEVFDSVGARVTGLVNGNFTKTAVVNGTPSSITITVAEVNAGTRPGVYMVVFTPDTVGSWSINVANATYNSQGWTENYSCIENLEDDIAGMVKELREGNIRVEVFKASIQIPARNVGVGRLDRIEVKTKADSAGDWTIPTSTKTLYFWYETMGDENPTLKGESA